MGISRFHRLPKRIAPTLVVAACVLCAACSSAGAASTGTPTPSVPSAATSTTASSSGHFTPANIASFCSLLTVAQLEQATGISGLEPMSVTPNQTPTTAGEVAAFTANVDCGTFHAGSTPPPEIVDFGLLIFPNATFARDYLTNSGATDLQAAMNAQCDASTEQVQPVASVGDAAYDVICTGGGGDTGSEAYTFTGFTSEKGVDVVYIAVTQDGQATTAAVLQLGTQLTAQL